MALQEVYELNTLNKKEKEGKKDARHTSKKKVKGDI